MRIKASDFKLGLFVLLGLALLLAGLFIFGASKWFEKKSVQETYVAGDVSGLKVGSQVMLRGVHVGEVKDINFSWNKYHVSEPRYVVVVFNVRGGVWPAKSQQDLDRFLQENVAKGLRARIQSQGLAGNTVLSLEYVKPSEYPPLPFPWKPRYVYIPSAKGQVNEILASVDQTVQKIKEIDFQKVVGLVEQDLLVGQRLLTHIDKANLPAVGTNLNALVTDLRGVTTQLQSFLGQTNQPASQVNIQQISRHTDELVRDMQSTVSKLERMLSNLDESSINATLQNLQRASENLQQTINQIKQYPSGALFGTPPPHAKSVESSRQ